MARDSFYSVSINTPESGWVVSRFFTKIAAARKWAKWCAERWETQIHRGGPGGEPVL